jgi:hypothetical protein
MIRGVRSRHLSSSLLLQQELGAEQSGDLFFLTPGPHTRSPKSLLK